MINLATGEFHYSVLKAEAVEGDEYISPKTKTLPASILRSDFSEITCVEGSNILYTAVGDKTGCIQLLRFNEIHRELKANSYGAYVNSIHFSHDDKKLIAVIGGRVHIWDLESNSSSPNMEVSIIGTINVAKFTRDGNGFVAGCSNGDVLIFDLLGNLLFTNSDGSSMINDIALTNDEEYAISVSNGGSTRVIKLSNGSSHYVHVNNLHQGPINSIDIASKTIGSSTSDIIVTGSDDGQFRAAVWDEGNDGDPPIIDSTLYFPLTATGNKIKSIAFDQFSGDILVANGYSIERWGINEDLDSTLYGFKQISSEPGIFPKHITTFGTYIYSCDGRSPSIANWSIISGDFIKEINIYSEIVQVAVWPDPECFNVSKPNWPMGPIAVGSPITCYAKRVSGISDMVWGDSLRSSVIHNIKIHGYYTEGFSTGILDDPNAEYLE